MPGSGQPRDPSFQTTDCARTITSFSRGTFASMAASLRMGSKILCGTSSLIGLSSVGGSAVISGGVTTGSKTFCGTSRCTSGLSPLGVGVGVSDGVTIGVPVAPSVLGSGPQAASIKMGTSATAMCRTSELYRTGLRTSTEIVHDANGPPA